MADAHSIEPLDDVKEYATTDWSGGDIDLVAASPTGQTMARWIQVVDIGSDTKLLVATTSASHPTDRAYTCVTNGETLVGKFVKIDTTSTVARVRVGW